MALTDNLIAYWKMDEASGQRNDSHGANHLTDNNTVGSATGKINSGADFERTDGDFLSIIDNPALSLGSDMDLTFSLWFKLETLPSDLGASFIIMQKNNDFIGGNTAEYQLWIDNQDRINFTLGNNSTNASVQGPNFSLSIGAWKHVIFGHDSAADKLYLQLDGVTPLEAAWSGGTFDGGSPLVFSSQFGSSFAFDGLIDEVGFWKGRWLSDSERTQLYGGGAGLPYANFGGATPVLPPRIKFAGQTRPDRRGIGA